MASRARFGSISAPRCEACGKSVYAAEQILAAGGAYHRPCFKCSICAKSLDVGSACDREAADGGRTLFCRSCYAKAHHGRQASGVAF